LTVSYYKNRKWWKKEIINRNIMFTLIALPYAPEALEPVISKETIGFHHGKHLQAYVDNLNKLLPGSEYEGMTLEEIVRQAPGGAVLNNAGQILNHEMYFMQFKPASEAVQGPEGALAAQIVKQWGSIEAFKAEFEAKGVGLFGSGWVWLSADADGTLVITQEANAANPIQKGLKPLLTFDVWEHAYYLDYQNRRAAHLAALWQIVDWSVVEKRWK
jgi:Fe-Mn family superoxide dismutase